MKPPHTYFPRPTRPKTLDSFYRWCRKLGHYHAYEAVERYRMVPNG